MKISDRNKLNLFLAQQENRTVEERLEQLEKNVRFLIAHNGMGCVEATIIVFSLILSVVAICYAR